MTNDVTTSDVAVLPDSAKAADVGKNGADGTGLTGNETEVFAVHGADPEVLAYAMAKYSRSSLSMKESLQGDFEPAGGAVSQYFLFSVWAPVDCRPGACGVRDRAAVAAGGDCAGG